MSDNNVINWFEIAATDLERAIAFYSKVFDFEMAPFEMPGALMAFFPMPSGGTGGALVKSPENTPSMDGSLVYFNAENRMDTLLERIEQNGGAVVMPRTSIGEHGFIAMFRDTEGNRVALHSPA